MFVCKDVVSKLASHVPSYVASLEHHNVSKQNKTGKQVLIYNAFVFWDKTPAYLNIIRL